MPNFKEVARKIRVEDVAEDFGLPLKASGKELRGACPACNTDDERSLALYPDTNSFRCFAEKVSGDSVALYAHLHGVKMYDALQALARERTAPQKPSEAGKAKSEPRSHTFDPQEFAQKLTYSPEVEALGLTEADAKKHRIGMHRGKLYIPICPADVSPITWCELKDGQFKLPSKWLTNIVPFKKRA